MQRPIVAWKNCYCMQLCWIIKHVSLTFIPSLLISVSCIASKACLFWLNMGCSCLYGCFLHWFPKYWMNNGFVLLCKSVVFDISFFPLVLQCLSIYDTLFLHYELLFDICRYLWHVSFFCLRYELLFFPRYHLDYSSLLYRKPLLGRPIVMDVFQDYVLVTYSPFDVHIFHVVILGELSPASNPVLQVMFFMSNLQSQFRMFAKFSP